MLFLVHFYSLFVITNCDIVFSMKLFFRSFVHSILENGFKRVNSGKLFENLKENIVRHFH